MVIHERAGKCCGKCLRDVVEIHFGSLEVVAETGFDMILAEITRIHPRVVAIVSSKLRNEGVLLCSGLMDEDTAAVEEALQHQGCAILSVLSEHEWVGIAAQRG